MLWFLAAFLASTVVTLFVVRSLRGRASYAWDHDFSGPQKFHHFAVARVGGVGIVAALCVAALCSLGEHPVTARTLLLLLACGVPAFGAGLIEDLTKSVSPRWRLAAAAASALMAAGVLGTRVTRTDLWGLDWLASMPLGAVLLAVLAVSGIANAVNIVDGFNGLASMCVAMMLAAFAYVAFRVGDGLVAALAVAGLGAVLGFFVWNYPAGLIFLGDGGAYFLGFFLSEVGLLLLIRNPRVSPLFPLLTAIYPVFETLFSMYRRKILKGRSVGVPDGVHLHSLVYRRLLRWAVGAQDAKMLTRRNSMTAPYLWLLCMFAVLPAVVFWNNSFVLGLFILLFGCVYVTLYAQIVRFRSPRWMVRRPRQSRRG